MSDSYPRRAALFALLSFVAAGEARAAVFLVDRSDDSQVASACADAVADDCSLRGAVIAANADPALDVIQLPAGSYPLDLAGNDDAAAGGDLDVTSEIELEGAGAETTFVDGSALDFGGQAIFEVRAGGVLRARGVTLREGQTSCVRVTRTGDSAGVLSLEDAVLVDCTGAPGYGIDNNQEGELALARVRIERGGRGGIRTSGVAVLEDAWLADNGGGEDAGIFVNQDGLLVLRDSTISGSRGAGLDVRSGARAVLVNTTISDSSSGNRAGVYVVDSGSSVALYNSTVAGNRGSATGGLQVQTGTSATLRNTLLADNLRSGSQPSDCQGTLASEGYNLIEAQGGSAPCTIDGDATGVVTGADPGLGALGANGGPTPTHALGAGSAAIDAGDPAGCDADDDGDAGTAEVVLTTDQRGSPRPVDGEPDGVARCDLGAFEFAPLDPFLCYKAKPSKGAAKFAPRAVALAVAFDPPGESTSFDVKKPLGLCNPSDRDGAGVVDPATHLLAYQIKEAKGEAKHVRRQLRLTNPFHDDAAPLLLDTIKVDRLLVPGAKGETEPPGPLGGSAVDAFECYAVKVSKGAPKFAPIPGVALDDQFTAAAKQFDLKKPKRACLAADVDGAGVRDAASGLLCYQAKPTPGQPKHAKRVGLFVEDGFGPGQLDALKEDELCVPSAVGEVVN